MQRSEMRRRSLAAGPGNAVDRMHTTMHAYLESICTQAKITFDDKASVTQLFSLIRKQHPSFPIGDRETRVLMQMMTGGMTQIIEASNPARNSKSMAHPNTLLEEPEAMLVLNAMRTLLHYLDARLSRRAKEG
jgi:hypothetical protein